MDGQSTGDNKKPGGVHDTACFRVGTAPLVGSYEDVHALNSAYIIACHKYT
jgi:hypothetical protein